ncbi:hypothetical protein SCMC78_49430 [Streptomyces sp. CMC78]|uniref:Secreted protein n=1 Tax=Streptomyces sp. CMC78 TaxID=3231512 RepID=A0AB33KMA1_9ACTN
MAVAMSVGVAVTVAVGVAVIVTVGGGRGVCVVSHAVERTTELRKAHIDLPIAQEGGGRGGLARKAKYETEGEPGGSHRPVRGGAKPSVVRFGSRLG